MCFTHVGSGLTHKHLTRLEKLSRGEHSSLLQKFVNYDSKKFHNIGPRPKVSHLGQLETLKAP
jgi:hypothetical protein